MPPQISTDPPPNVAWISPHNSASIAFLLAALPNNLASSLALQLLFHSAQMLVGWPIIRRNSAIGEAHTIRLLPDVFFWIASPSSLIVPLDQEALWPFPRGEIQKKMLRQALILPARSHHLYKIHPCPTGPRRPPKLGPASKSAIGKLQTKRRDQIDL